ncbi:MAG: glycosyl hydrolase [Nonlabens sp.]
MRKSILFYLFILVFALSEMSITAQTAVGNGSYTNTHPGADAAGRNGFPSGLPQLIGNAAGKPVPTNDWWSTLIKENHADNLFNYPMTMKTINLGLIVTYIPWGPIGDSAPIRVGLQGLNASQVNVSDYSDWTVTMNWNDGAHDLKATTGIGMPFVYFEKDNDDILEIQVTAGNTRIINEMLVIENARSGADFVFYAPSGSTWTQSGNLYSSTLNGANYWSMAMLPQSTSNVNAVAQEYKKYAYVFPTDTQVSWNYDPTTSNVTTDFTVTTDVKEGTETNVLLGLLPHQWANLAPASPTADEYEYQSIRGALKTLDGNTFTVENSFKGILPTLPELGQYSTGFDPADLDQKISNIENDQLATWTDSYNEGQVMNRLIQTARIADQTQNYEARDKMIETIKERLEDWLTYEAGEVAFLFYYNNDWNAMIGYPAGHGQDTNLNDHHFHWGYFIHAAAFMEQFEPGWSAQWGDMINVLIRDAASDDRNDAQFPFLRNFSPYAGHSWANGFASFPQGNDQESTSESMQFASSLIHWGTITENDAIRDLGVYIYTTEQTAIEEYWLDVHNRNFGSNQQYSLVSRVWGNSYDNGTFWTADIAASYGIEMYPMHGGSFYLGHNQAYAQSLWTEITNNTGILNNEVNPNLWHDTYWKYLSLTDPQASLNLYNSFPDRDLKFGISDAQTYHWLHSVNAMGVIDASITADYPIASAFNDNGSMTYVAHNYSDSAINVTFSDGFVLVVPANSMATNRDIDVAGTLTANDYELQQNQDLNLSVATTGSNITKVEFYMGENLLGEQLAAPFDFTVPNMGFGIYTLYAKVYQGSSFNFTNVIRVQVGDQVPYSGTPIVLPGTIEAAHYDIFEGGNGQNISYYDASTNNEGDFRTTESVDALTVNNEGDTVGWISAGEWMEYTVDVQNTGCYDLTFRYASGNSSGGGPFFFELDNQQVSPNIAVAGTGDWNVWSIENTTINLTQGVHVLRVFFENGEFNLGRMTFAYNPAGCIPPQTIGLPFDFETAPTSTDFTDFDGGTGTVIPLVAPQANNNPSSNAAMIVRDGGMTWAGSYLNLDGTLDFSNDNLISLKLWTEAPVGTVVRMKLEQQSNSSNFAERDFTTIKTGEWEEIVWDFGSLNNTVFDRLVFMFDFGNTGDGSNTSTFFFDDVQQTATLSTGMEISDQDIKIYPNPISHKLYIDAGHLELDRVEVFNLFGQRIMNRKSNLKSIPMQSLKNGVYLLKFYLGERILVKKVVKE